MFLFRKKDSRLPPNQKAIDAIMGWGTQHPGIVKELPSIEREEWSLTVDGEVENPLRLDWGGFTALPQAESVSDFHCVEGWSVLDQRWEGVLFKTLTEKAKPKPTCKYVRFECYDGYTTSLPLEKLMDEEVIIAHRLNGEDLPQPLGGPVRLVVPKLYAYKSPMWLMGITFMEKDRLGYWESGIYSNTADPWKNDRYNR
ncbi:MAG: molybdopterin-dependent oxidoreductase [Candidatus Bathyarchaeota archaeon]|nr:molybdopterin-dependent oxidoreductase [Candidatus Bathyarchaeota archaeon]